MCIKGTDRERESQVSRPPLYHPHLPGSLGTAIATKTISASPTVDQREATDQHTLWLFYCTYNDSLWVCCAEFQQPYLGFYDVLECFLCGLAVYFCNVFLWVSCAIFQWFSQGLLSYFTMVLSGFTVLFYIQWFSLGFLSCFSLGLACYVVLQ